MNKTVLTLALVLVILLSFVLGFTLGAKRGIYIGPTEATTATTEAAEPVHITMKNKDNKVNIVKQLFIMIQQLIVEKQRVYMLDSN